MFINEIPFEKRKEESNRILSKYPDRIPIICEKHLQSNINDLIKKKFLVPNNLTIGQFIFILRKRMTISSEQAMFLFINDILPPIGSTIGPLYNEHKNNDGFLYILYSGESVFGK